MVNWVYSGLYGFIVVDIVYVVDMVDMVYVVDVIDVVYSEGSIG